MNKLFVAVILVMAMFTTFGLGCKETPYGAHTAQINGSNIDTTSVLHVRSIQADTIVATVAFNDTFGTTPISVRFADSARVSLLADSSKTVRANSITGANITNGSLTYADMLDSTITGVKVGSLAIGLANLAANSVNSAKIVDASIVAGDIAAQTITENKMDSTRTIHGAAFYLDNPATVTITAVDTASGPNYMVFTAGSNYCAFLQYGDVGASGGRMNAGYFDTLNSTLVTGVTGKFTGRVTATDFAASDSVIGVTADFSGKITGSTRLTVRSADIDSILIGTLWVTAMDTATNDDTLLITVHGIVYAIPKR